MRSLLYAAFAISLACLACGPISDWPTGESDDGPDGLEPSDGGAIPTADAGNVLDAGAVGGGGAPGGNGGVGADAGLPTQDGDASGACNPDAAGADAGDAQLPDGGVDAFAADAGDASQLRPFPVPPDAQTPIDAAQADAQSDAAHVATAPGLPCW